MSRNCCNTESSCYNTCCNPCNNGISGFNNSFFYTLAIFFIFGVGFGPGSFWGNYNNILGCSGFNNGWCNNIRSNNFNTGNYGNSNFSGNSLSNTNFSNADFAGFLSGLSGNSNYNVGNLTAPSI